MKIQDINTENNKVRYDILEANIIEDGRKFCATSFDNQWACSGIVLDSSEKPMLQVNSIYKLEWEA